MREGRGGGGAQGGAMVSPRDAAAACALGAASSLALWAAQPWLGRLAAAARARADRRARARRAQVFKLANANGMEVGARERARPRVTSFEYMDGSGWKSTSDYTLNRSWLCIVQGGEGGGG